MTQRAAVTKTSSSRFKFISDIIGELKKVVWLSRRDALYLTSLVLLISVVAGLVLGLLDLGFTGLIKAILGK